MKRSVRSILLAGLTAISLWFTSTGGAVTLPLQDRGITTYDPNTGLEWLDLNFTLGQSYLSVLHGWHGYTTTEGFRFATREEVRQLFLHAGALNIASGVAPSSTENAAPAQSLLSLTGITLAQTGQDRSWMFYDPATEPSLPPGPYVPSAVFGVWRAPAGDQGFFLLPGIIPLEDYGSYEMASALVRVVPEPSSSMLLLTAIGLGLASRRRARP